MDKNDIDGDGVLTVNDITILIDMYLCNYYDRIFDKDGDGQFTINDITTLINLYLEADE